MAVRHLLTCALFALAAVQTPAQTGLRLMSWNVENLFDVEHDEGCNDEEFLPTGNHRWTSGRLWRKITDIARVVAAVADDGGLPDLIGLSEVENDSVLTRLTERGAMRHLGYRYVMTHSTDHRGMDVALLYQPERFRLLDHRDVRVPSVEHGLNPTRDILYIKGLTFWQERLDTLHIIVVHLPSRTSGFQGDRNRRLAAETLWTLVDSIGEGRHIIALGDFNAAARDRIFRQAPLRLTDDPHAPGTYCYRGHWQWIDHILLSSSLHNASPARAFSLPWLLEEDIKYGTQKPRRTYFGPVYHGGISDHLPIYLDLPNSKHTAQ